MEWIDPSPSESRATSEEIKVEAAQIIASLSYGAPSFLLPQIGLVITPSHYPGSEVALTTLLRLHAHRALILAIANAASTSSLGLRSANVRALRALVSSIAEIVGPSEYGLRPETNALLRGETKEALNLIFTVCRRRSCWVHLCRYLRSSARLNPTRSLVRSSGQPPF